MLDSRSHFSDALLVIALTQQRPDQDAEVGAALMGSVRGYGTRLDEVHKDLAEDEDLRVWKTSDSGQQLRFYEPSLAFMWGSYDLGVFYLADDIGHVLEVAGHSGAAAQEYVFGPLYGDLDEREERVLEQVLGGDAGPDATIGLVCLKIGEHHLSIGGRPLLGAMRRWILARAADSEIDCLVYSCWSWGDLCVLVVDDDAGKVQRFFLELESARISSITDDKLSPVMHRNLHSAASERWAVAQSPVATDLLRRWLYGRWATPNDASAAQVLARAGQSHLLVTCRQHLGFLLEPSGMDADTQAGLDLAGQSADEQLRRLLRRTLRDARHPTSALRKAQHDALDAAVCSLDKDLKQIWRQAGHYDGPDPARRVVAFLLIHPKPGHWGEVRAQVDQVVAAWGVVGSDAATSFVTTEGEHGRLALRLVDHHPWKGCLTRVASVSLWFRLQRKLSWHLLDVTTVLDFVGLEPPRLEAAHDPGAHIRAHPARGPLGLELLHSSAHPDVQDYERDALCTIGLGVGETSALMELLGIVRHCSAHRDTFGAMLDLTEFGNLVRTVVVDAMHGARQGDGAVPPIDIDPEGRIAQAVRVWLSLGQQAYLQRVQYTPVVGGGVRLEAEIPFGVNQLVAMVGGLARAVLGVYRQPGQPSSKQAAEARTNGRAGPVEDPQHRGVVLVVFGADETFAIRTVERVSVLKMNVMSATDPLALTLLMHELGHVIEHYELHQLMDGQATRTWRDERQEALAIIEAAQRALRGRAPTDADANAQTVLRDIFAHATWRRVGCKNDWTIFQTQLLAAFALGLRQDNRRAVSASVIQAWATTLCHLRLQELMVETEKEYSWSKAVQRAAYLLFWELQTETIIEWVKARRPWWEGEVTAARARLSADPCPGSNELMLTRAMKGLWSVLLLGLGVRRESGMLKAFETLGDIFDPHWSDQDRRNQYDRLRDACRSFLRTEEVLGRALCRVEAALDQVPSAPSADELEREVFQNSRTWTPPPWDVIDGCGHPTELAFIWARALLMAFTGQFLDPRWRTGQNITIFREPRDFRFQSTCSDGVTRPGVYLDPRGRVFALGRAHRSSLQQARAAVLASLGGLAMRMRAGQVWRHFARGRALPRFQLPTPIPATLDLPMLPGDSGARSLEVLLLDVGPGGFRARLNDQTLASPEAVEGAVLRPRWGLDLKKLSVRVIPHKERRDFGLAMQLDGEPGLLPRLPCLSATSTEASQ